MSLARTYGDNAARELAGNPRARLGGPRLPSPISVSEDVIGRLTSAATFGSHMPLDIDAHWEWRNPLNIIPAIVLLLIVIAMVAAIF
jgi:hypothetical protein